MKIEEKSKNWSATAIYYMLAFGFNTTLAFKYGVTKSYEATLFPKMLNVT